ncbi:imidazoleglycerol-phosphate dehydratase, chloroplastic-like isoform X1 [Lathyrus oleraceus]|uniref:Imidazoleglycerol-phosphate dehydratase, variant 2 n=2 Tax=Pisum sativum TaxID=3888 RepID=A0A9D5ASZ8_PEA|nr:imidazoleglycerol-phosphate dehydratase, chloroplastic-like isoform X1 [Pisum sativum]KAI5423247.1 imidazoleglycerol-phosphate dehydratase, variant 2 [Pisum sativum]
MELYASSHSLPNYPSSFLFKPKITTFRTTLFPTKFAPFKASFFSPNHLTLTTPMNPPTTSISSAAFVEHNNGSTSTSLPFHPETRVGEVKRVTKETNVSVKINLDGSGVADSSTGIPFLDHMLDQLASHGLFDVHVKVSLTRLVSSIVIVSETW